ncbi:hypothetical protein HOF78_01810 [Candidatus Woesearchaeota archaeon]|jgi:hypothetical protein|nr:hypothetical protein [Candidatus Woesearchaeota archaeon]
MSKLEPQIFNLLGEEDSSFSLEELSAKLQEITGVLSDKVLFRVKKLISVHKLEIINGKVKIPRQKKVISRKIEFSKLSTKLKRKSDTRECLHPNKDECDKKIIKAHSIQNNKILNKISEDGDIIQINNCGAELVGRGKATTFKGFCSKHDSALFLPIEQIDFEPKNEEQCFLYAYRSIAKEIMAKKSVISEMKEFIKIKGNNYPSINNLIMGNEVGLNDLGKIKEKLDHCLINSKFGGIKTKLVILDRDYSVAVSSCFYPVYDFKGKMINNLEDYKSIPQPMIFTIFPQNGKTYILLSYLSNDSKMEEFTKQMSEFSDAEVNTVVNNLIVLYCENFVLSPKKWSAMSEQEKKEMTKLFNECPGLPLPQDLTKKRNFDLFI